MSIEVNNNNNELVLKPINELLGDSFYIPAYQRGYRWSSRQVVELLNDVYEFCDRKAKTDEDFYCLQPVVVKKRGSQWELVDGQQRLTTILLILGYFNSRFAEDFRKQLYSLKYETRPDSREYLLLLDESKKEQNIDFHFIYQASATVREWFKDKMYRVNDIESAFLNQVKVIWYQISDNEDAIDVFTRLNMGKIPLVNAELVKALFLKSSNFSIDSQTAKQLQQLNIAQEWDAIEKRLQEDAFWYFVSNKPTKTNRIEFVLELAARKLDAEGILGSDKLKVFLQFNRLINESDANVVSEWLKIKQCFMTLEEWFNDRALFHLVGYLVSQGTTIATLFDLSEESNSKHAFRHALLDKIFSKIFPKKSFSDLARDSVENELSLLGYESGAARLRPILLLFNIASLLANPVTNARFQFDKYKLDNWDIEHIRSVTSDIPTVKDKQKSWLINVVDYISADGAAKLDDETENKNDEALLIRKDAKLLLSFSSYDNAKFEELYNRVLALYDPVSNEDVDNSIGNLTLLDSSTNRSYKNAVFPIKRSKIIALDKKATFVPLCTKNVFLKYYSKQVDKMLYWEPKDSQDHQAAMVDSIYGFFSGEGVHV